MTRILTLILALLIACSSPTSYTQQTQPTSSTAPTNAQQAQPSAKSPDEVQLSPELIDHLMAPVALYPDALLAQILICAGSPFQVTELNNWLHQNSNLKGSEVQKAAEKKGFDPSFVALSAFPQVVEMLAKDLKWTKLLGQTFAADKDAVFDSIQRLRAEAQEIGNLKTSPEQNVTTQTSSSGEQVIAIQPANPEVVYVPTYDSQAVYTQPADNTAAVGVASGLMGFTTGIILGSVFDDDDDYWGPYGWNGSYMNEDAWENYSDYRQKMSQERTERTEVRQEQRTERQGQRQEGRTERKTGRQEQTGAVRQKSQARKETGTTRRPSGASRERQRTQPSSRGYSGGSQSQVKKRSGGREGAFSSYESGRSARSSSMRGQRSVSSSRGSYGGSRGGGRGGGGRGGGGRRR